MITYTLSRLTLFRIYDVARVIQMNMEISLISAHLVLLYPEDPTNIEVQSVSGDLFRLNLGTGSKMIVFGHF